MMMAFPNELVEMIVWSLDTIWVSFVSISCVRLVNIIVDLDWISLFSRSFMKYLRSDFFC